MPRFGEGPKAAREQGNCPQLGELSAEEADISHISPSDDERMDIRGRTHPVVPKGRRIRKQFTYLYAFAGGSDLLDNFLDALGICGKISVVCDVDREHGSFRPGEEENRALRGGEPGGDQGNVAPKRSTGNSRRSPPRAHRSQPKEGDVLVIEDFVGGA